MSFRGSSSTCLYFHRAEARAVNHSRIDRRLLSPLSLPACTIRISLNAFSVTTHTGTTLCVITYIHDPVQLRTRVSMSTPKMNMNFSHRGKLSNGFSVSSPMCFIAGRLVICKNMSLLKRSILVREDGPSMNHHAIECLAIVLIVIT